METWDGDFSLRLFHLFFFVFCLFVCVCLSVTMSRFGRAQFTTCISCFLALTTQILSYAPVPTPVTTRWDSLVDPNHAHMEYPRPTLLRTDPLSTKVINGVWKLNRSVPDLSAPPINSGYPDGEDILVPFPIESGLSGVRNLTDNGYAFYYFFEDQRVLPPRAPSRTRMLLHFGAVDWETHVWVNGHKQVPLSPAGIATNGCPSGSCHRGGFDAFYYDITDSVTGPCTTGSAPNNVQPLCPPGKIEIIVGIFDPTDCDGRHPGGCNQMPNGTEYLVNPLGKQSRQSFLETGVYGTRYTSTSGIWDTVWFEGVPSAYIADVVVSWHELLVD